MRRLVTRPRPCERMAVQRIQDGRWCPRCLAHHSVGDQRHELSAPEDRYRVQGFRTCGRFSWLRRARRGFRRAGRRRGAAGAQARGRCGDRMLARRHRHNRSSRRPRRTHSTATTPITSSTGSPQAAPTVCRSSSRPTHVIDSGRRSRKRLRRSTAGSCLGGEGSTSGRWSSCLFFTVARPLMSFAAPRRMERRAAR